ncbi:hypothetical protein Ancab_013230 [Ancistrocladus abbreviatus]
MGRLPQAAKKARLKPPNNLRPDVNSMQHGEMGPSSELNLATTGFAEKGLEGDRIVAIDEEQNRTWKGRSIRKKSLEEIFSATPIICRSERRTKRASRMRRNSWDNKEPTSSSTVWLGSGVFDDG